MELTALERKQSKCGAQPIPGALLRISGTALVVSIRGDGLWVVVSDRYNKKKYRRLALCPRLISPFPLLLQSCQCRAIGGFI